MRVQLRWCSVLWGLFAAGVSVFGPGRAWGSALMRVEEQAGVIRFVARLHYSGAARTRALVEASTDEIRRMWNESRAEIVFRGRTYRTVFEITHTEDLPFSVRTDCADNFIEIADPVSAGDRSWYYLWGNRGRFYTSDELGASTTAAHEFGHGLGLEHNALDQRTAPVPGIMFARGTWVRPEFQWDPAAQAGAPGGSVRPHTRRVRAEDVQSLGLQGIQLDAQGIGCVGGGKSRTMIID